MKPRSKRLSFGQRETLILNTAILLFSRNGFNGTTTKAIAEKAGINEALIFRHFKSKGELYTAILNSQIKEKGKKLDKLAPLLKEKTVNSLEKDLCTLAKFIVTENKKDPHVLRMMTFSGLENHRLSKALFKQKLPLVAFTETFFELKLKQKSKYDIKFLSRTFLSLVYHYIYITQILNTKDFYQGSQTQTLLQFTQIFLKGIEL